jgi:Tol biopolymer transport system component
MLQASTRALVGAIALALAASTTAACAGADRSTSAANGVSRTATHSGPVLRGRLAFGRFEGGDNVQVFTANADGSGIKPLLRGTGGDQPHWSPNGSELTLTTFNKNHIVGSVVSADGNAQRVFTAPDGGPNLACVIWSPDSKRLACEGFDDQHPRLSGVYTVRSSDGQGVTRVTRHRDLPCAYSPDGRWLLLLRMTPGDEEHNRLMTVQLDGSHPRLVTTTKVGLSCDWSHRGHTLLTEADGALLVVSPAGKVNKIRVSGHASRGAFSPDDSHIIFSLDTGDGQEDIYTMKVDGSQLHQITATPDANEEFGDWGP